MKPLFLKYKWLFIFFTIFLKGVFGQSQLIEVPSPPNYADEKYWAALPTRTDEANLVPTPELNENQNNAAVDVFYLYPTMLTHGNPKKQWNGDLNDEKLNKKTLKTAIRLQATIFNETGKIYSPFYRQAHLKSFFVENSKNESKKAKAKAALELAYQDVKAAFQYYLEHYNHGRPIIIAGHSQGARHGSRLLKEFFDGQPLEQKLVVAYLPGMPIQKTMFESLKVCKNEHQTNCYVSWRTFKTGYYPKNYTPKNQIACVNPLSWKTDEIKISNSENLGSVLRDFNKIIPNLVNAKVENGLLWCDRPRFKGSWLIRTKNYHAGDFNLFYINVRENCTLRANNYLTNHYLK